MKFINGQIFQNGQFIPGGIAFEKRITAAGEEVTAGKGPISLMYDRDTGKGKSCMNSENPVDPEECVNPESCVDLKGCYVIPGLVDIHTHAAMGEDASDGSSKGLEIMSRYYAAEGVTSFLPTTMTLKEPELLCAMETIRDFKRPADGAKIAGIHMEGPFLSYEKRGAQNADNLHVPDRDMFHRLNQASGGMVRLITIAPEVPGAMEFIKEISPICAVSLGHTTADYQTAKAAYEAGATQATHLYNGMPGLHHREPSVIGAAFDSGAFAELIPDGYHVDPSVIRMTAKLFGDRLVLISDSLRCAGMPDGDYMLGGQSITMKNGKAVLTGTETLAGSSIHLMEGIRRAVRFGLSLEAAVYAATMAPARAIRMEAQIGSLEVGKCADLVVLDENLQVKAVYVEGKKVR